MTTKNVMLSSDAKSTAAIDFRMNMGIPTNNPLFSKSLLPSPKTNTQFITITTKKLSTNVMISETAGTHAPLINALVESMRDSSPSRLRSPSSLSESSDNKASWAVNHPSALSMFDEIVKASKGKQIVMFLDYDGTLSPIVQDPEKAFMTNEMREAVRDVARCFPTAIVTGRRMDKVYKFVKLAGLYYAGSHGMDIKGPSKKSKKGGGNDQLVFQAASEFLPMIDEVYKILLEKTKCISGSKVENNKFCLSVHFRCVDEKMWGILAEEVRIVLNNYPKLKLTQGRKVLEIKPIIEWDKGRALEFLLESLGYANSDDVFPIYIGDDRTDEDAFKVLRERGQGLGILVSKVSKDTNATYSLREPTEVKDFLRRLVKWKRMSNTY